MKVRLITGSTTALALVLATSAAAQDAPVAETEASPAPIIVTAQKRSQQWLDVPIALSVIGGEELREERAVNPFDILRQAPGVTGSNPSDELTEVAIRGVSSEDYGISSDPTVGVFFDGVYLGRAENTATNFIDLERVEIARGPQGALFGRATPGGAISLVPVRPGPGSEYSAFAEAGTPGFLRAAVISNVPLGESTFARGSVIYDRSGNYVDNLTTGEELGREESLSGRLALRHEFGPATAIELTGWYEDFAGDPWLYRNFAETVEDPADLADLGTRFDYIGEIFSDVSASDLEESRRAWGSILRIEHGFDSGITLSSISSVVGNTNDYLEDYDGTDLFLFNYGQYGKATLYTQEVRLVSGDAQPLRWFAGALAYREDVTADIVQSYGDFDLCVFNEFSDAAGCAGAGSGVTDTFIFARSKHRGIALYGEAEADLTDRLTLTAGVRYTNDRKRLLINAPTPGGFLPADEVGYTVPTDGLDVVRAKTFTSWQPRVALNFRPNATTAVYALYSEGEKPGGFDTFNAFSPAFNAERVQTFEAGLKGAAARGRLTYAIAAFVTDYSDLQVLVADGPRDVVQNAASASSNGAEVEAVYSAHGFEFGLRGALIDATFDTFADPFSGVDFSGNRLTYTPKWSLGTTLGFDRAIAPDWSGFARIDASIQSRQFLTPANDLFASNPAYENIDLRIGVRTGGELEIYFFGQNVTGADYVANADVTDYDVNLGGYLAQFARPAVFGIGISHRQ